jgi:hypothetical protein
MSPLLACHLLSGKQAEVTLRGRIRYQPTHLEPRWCWLAQGSGQVSAGQLASSEAATSEGRSPSRGARFGEAAIAVTTSSSGGVFSADACTTKFPWVPCYPTRNIGQRLLAVCCLLCRGARCFLVRGLGIQGLFTHRRTAACCLLPLVCRATCIATASWSLTVARTPSSV